MRIRYLFALAVFLAGAFLVAIYWPGLHGGFFFDDGPSILQAEEVRLESLSVESLRQVFQSGHAGPSGRPVAQLSFALNHYSSGFDPFVFKATNLAIHLANGVLLLYLLIHLLATAMPSARQRNVLVVAGAAAALWLLHPIQLLPVLHVVQRMTSLSAFFLLAALLLHILGRERGGRAGAMRLVLAWGLFWPLSYFSKETGVLFPLFALAWELIVRRSSSGELDRFARGLATLAGLSLLAAAVYMLAPAGQWLWAGYDIRPFSLGERLLTEGRVLWFYFGLILLPRLEALGLYHDDIAISTGLFAPWATLPALAGLAALVWCAWWLRRRASLVSFGIAWFLIGHALESTVLPLEIAHEHRNYLPLLGIVLVAACALLHALESTGVRKTIGVALAITALAYFPFVTALRAHQFGDDVRRTQIEAQHHRGSSRAQYEAGIVLAGLPEAALPNSPIHAFARRHYELAGELDRDSKFAWLGLIHLSCKAGMPVERAWVSELSRRLRESPFAPADRNLLYSLKEMSIEGGICLARPDMERLFSAAFVNPTVSPFVQAMLYSWYADYLMLREHDLPAASAALASSLRLVPANPSNRLKWAQLVLLEGRRDEAAQLLKALQDAPLSSSEKRTAMKLLACLEGDRAACGAI
ncbi:MAG: pilus assembly protein PilF [Nitrosomonadales bacterium]|nr:pilus assembly protein PilF [Nitrosomonadales bacterium]